MVLREIRVLRSVLGGLGLVCVVINIGIVSSSICDLLLDSEG